MKIKRLYAAAALLLIFPACRMIGPESGAGSASDGKAAVSIGIEGAGIQGRTVLPTAALTDVQSWELWGEKSPAPETLLADFSGTAPTVYLETGTWNFTLKGHNSNDALILQGSIPGRTITLEGPNVLSFAVAPLREGNGTFKITLTLPSGHGITKAEVWEDGVKIGDPTPDTNQVVFEKTYPAGDYYFSVRLYKDSELYGAVSELAQVRGNLRSETAYALTLADLNRAYTIRYHLNGGQLAPGVDNPGSYRSADKDFALPSPARTDYYFEGWHDNQDLTGSPVADIPQGSTGDRDFYAKWLALGTNITLKPDAGEGAFSENSFTIYKSGGTGSQTVDMDGSGYAKPRWFVDGEPKGTGTSIAIDAADYDAGNHTLVLLAIKDGVSWSKQLAFTVNPGTLRTVIWRANDGTGTIHAIKTVEAGNPIGSEGFPADPSRTGYDFAEWNTLAEGIGGTVFNSESMVSADATVYARWNPHSYTVSFVQNYNALDTTTLHNKTVTVPAVTITDFPADPSRTDYNFAGWNTLADGTGSVFSASTPVGGTMIVYAQWAHEEFTISLNPDAGEGAFSQNTFVIYKSGGTGSQTVELAGSGYARPRWFVDGEPGGTGDDIVIHAADYGLGKHTLVLLASKSGVSWSKQLAFTVEPGTLRTVIWRANDGTGTIHAIKTVEAGNPIGSEGFPADPSRTGYDFTGWNTQAGGGGAAFDSESTVSADTTVYAQWTGKTWTVTFKANGGTPIQDITKTVLVPATTIADFPANPSRTNYNFAGWNTLADGTGSVFSASTPVGGDITVYAQWTHEEFTISLKPDAGEGAFSQTDFSISKSGGTGSQTVDMDGSGYAKPRWFVDGEPAGTGDDIVIHAADYGLGKHTLVLLASKSGVSWSKQLIFTVTP